MKPFARALAGCGAGDDATHACLTVVALAGTAHRETVRNCGDKLELRGPIGGYFVWEASMGGPLLLVARGSGIVPLMAMLRHRAAVGSSIATRLLYSSRSFEDIIYRDELDHLMKSSTMLEVVQTLTRGHPPGWTGYTRSIDTQMLREMAWPVDQRSLSCAG